MQSARGRWTYDVSGQYGRNSFAFAVADSLNVSLGPASTKTTFDAGTLSLDQFAANAGASRTLRVKGFTRGSAGCFEARILIVGTSSALHPYRVSTPT